MLPPEEWARLAGTEAETVWPHLSPAGARVLVVEQAGAIVGCWVQLLVMHAECLWIQPSHRGKGGVLRRLVRAMGALANEYQTAGVWTAATTPAVRALLARVGAAPVTGEHYIIPVLWRR